MINHMIKFIKNIFLSERLHLVQLLWKECLKIIHILMNKIEPRNDICLVIKYYIKYYKTLILIAKNRLPDIPREFLTWRKKNKDKKYRKTRGDPKSEKQRWCWHFSRHGPRSQFNRKIKERTGASWSHLGGA